MMRILLGSVMFVFFTGLAGAQSQNLPKDIDPESLSRLPLVKRDSLDENGKRIYDYIRGRNETAPKTGPGGVSLHSPAAAEPIQMLNQALRKTVIGAKYFEISALIAAREFDQQYEWSGHEPGALRAGVDQAVIDAIKYNRDLKGLDDKDAECRLFLCDFFVFEKEKIERHAATWV
jgi:4-carboxymuconolactone decarboxylase